MYVQTTSVLPGPHVGSGAVHPLATDRSFLIANYKHHVLVCDLHLNCWWITLQLFKEPELPAVYHIIGSPTYSGVRSTPVRSHEVRQRLIQLFCPQ